VKGKVDSMPKYSMKMYAGMEAKFRAFLISPLEINLISVSPHGCFNFGEGILCRLYTGYEDGWAQELVLRL
jgi:hypothetical protein